LQLEIHWEFLRDRGKSAMDFLAPLAEIGYRGIRSRYQRLAQWEEIGRTEFLSRFSLRAEK